MICENSFDPLCVFSRLYISLLCFGKKQGKTFLFFFSSDIQHYSTIQKSYITYTFWDLSVVSLERNWKILCLRADFLFQVKRSILLHQKLRSFLFFYLLLIIHCFYSYHFTFNYIIIDICLKILTILKKKILPVIPI